MSNNRVISPMSRQASPGKLSDNRSFLGRTSMGSYRNQKVVSVDDRKLKKINDNLGKLCRELEIDETDIEIEIQKPVSALLLETTSVSSQPPIILQATRQKSPSHNVSIERISTFVNDKKVLESPLRSGKLV